MAAEITASLIVDDGAAAIEFYKKAFGAVEIYRMTAPDNPKIMHAELRIAGAKIYLADEFPEWGVFGPKKFGGSAVTISLHVDKDADAVFSAAVEAGATVKMPIADMFWGDRFGKLDDPFGHSWSVSHTVAVLTPEQMMTKFLETMTPQASTA